MRRVTWFFLCSIAYKTKRPSVEARLMTSTGGFTREGIRIRNRRDRPGTHATANPHAGLPSRSDEAPAGGNAAGKPSGFRASAQYRARHALWGGNPPEGPRGNQDTLLHGGRERQ